jgi:low affinity Fe/Cu permease
MSKLATDLSATKSTHSEAGIAHDGFRRFASFASRCSGSSIAFFLAVGLVLGWAAMGPIYGYSDTWELVINTSTTIITFLMVFLIQNSQNRESLALHLKLDELLRAVETARTSLVNLENLSDQEMEALKKEFVEISKEKCDSLQMK